MFQITKSNYKLLTLGASIYSTGGGFEMSNQNKIFAKLFEIHDSLNVVGIDELSDDDFVCTSYGVGSASDTDVDLSKQLKLGLQTLEAFTNKKYTAIFEGETNIECLAFQISSQLGLPVLDADATGGRAVPEIQFDNFYLADFDLLPLVAVTQDSEVAILTKSPNGQTVEKFVRNMNVRSGGSVAVFDHSVSVANAKQSLTLGVIQRSLNLGKFVMESQNINQIINYLDGNVLIQGFVTKIEMTNDPLEGFLHGYYYVTSNTGDILRVFVKNENLMAWKNEVLIASCPDFIITIDNNNLLGVHNSKVFIGQSTTIIATKATQMWRSQKAVDLFSPKTLGFDAPSTLLN
jgi:uncharacterized protein